VAIDIEMRGGIDRGTQVALDHLAVEIEHHHLFGCQRLVTHAAGLDDHQARLRIAPRDVAAGPGDQARGGQQQIALAHGLT
jgi:hypothetical protein